jgi:hypothetical protein
MSLVKYGTNKVRFGKKDTYIQVEGPKVEVIIASVAFFFICCGLAVIAQSKAA